MGGPGFGATMTDGALFHLTLAIAVVPLVFVTVIHGLRNTF